MRIAHLRFVGSPVTEPAQRMGEGWLWPSVKISPTRRDSDRCRIKNWRSSIHMAECCWIMDYMSAPL